MRLEAGQLVILNRNIGQIKNGEMFKVIRVTGALAVIKSIVTNDEYFVYKYFSGLDLVEKVGLHV